MKNKKSQSEYYKVWYEKNKEVRRTYNKKLVESKAEYYKQYHQKYYVKNKEILAKKKKETRILMGWTPKTNFLYLKEICRICKNPENKKLIKLSKNKTRQYYICRECNRKRLKQYRDTENGRINTQNAIKKSTDKYRFKQKAREVLNYNISIGRIIKPSKCQNCPNTKNIQGHHKDYFNPLEVEWLCVGCHADSHKK